MSSFQEILGGLVGGTAPILAGLFVLLGGIFGSNEKTVGGLPMLFLGALSCAAAFVWAPETGFWTTVERFAWWGGGILAALGAVIAFNQKGGAGRALACALFLPAMIWIALHEPESAEFRLAEVERQATELEQQVDEDIPALIAVQEEALVEIRAELESPEVSPVRRAELEAEARDVVRFVLALELQQGESRETLSRLRSLKRTLERQASAQELLGGQVELLEQYDEISREAGARLAVRLDTSVGSGAIADALVEDRYRELLGERE